MGESVILRECVFLLVGGVGEEGAWGGCLQGGVETTMLHKCVTCWHPFSDHLKLSMFCGYMVDFNASILDSAMLLTSEPWLSEKIIHFLAPKLSVPSPLVDLMSPTLT